MERLLVKLCPTLEGEHFKKFMHLELDEGLGNMGEGQKCDWACMEWG